MEKEHLLIRLLDDILAGTLTLDECVAKYPQFANEITALAKVAGRIKSEGVPPTNDFKKRAFEALSAQMDTYQPAPMERNKSGWLKKFFSPRAVVFRLILVVVIFILSGGGVVFASQDSLPGDFLYTVKRTTENAHLMLTFTPEAKADIYLKLIQTRVEETLEATSQGSNAGTLALDYVPEEINGAVQQISETSDKREPLLLQLIEVSNNEQNKLNSLLDMLNDNNNSPVQKSLGALRRGQIIGEISYYNHDFLDTSPSVYDENLELNVFEIEGNLLAVEDNHWNVGGINLANVIKPDSVPEPGTKLKLKGIVSNNTIFIGNIEIQPLGNGKTVIAGLVSNRNEDNTVVYVGGLEFRDISSLKAVSVGTFVLLEGTEMEGVFHPDEKEDEGEDTEHYGIPDSQNGGHGEEESEYHSFNDNDIEYKEDDFGDIKENDIEDILKSQLLDEYDHDIESPVENHPEVDSETQSESEETGGILDDVNNHSTTEDELESYERIEENDHEDGDEHDTEHEDEHDHEDGDEHT